MKNSRFFFGGNMVMTQGISPRKIPTTKKQQEVLERHLSNEKTERLVGLYRG